MVVLVACPASRAFAHPPRERAQLVALSTMARPSGSEGVSAPARRASAAEPDRASAADGGGAPSLTLRPSRGLEQLAAKVVRVLSLRVGDGEIIVGGAPPPGLLEAVPEGHLALAREEGRVRLVLGGRLGTYYETSVPLVGTASEPEVRSLALAVEALRDRALEAEEGRAGVQAEPEPASTAAPEPAAVLAQGSPEPPHRDYGAQPLMAAEGEPVREVKPMFFVRAYSGASTQSEGVRMGIATGGGLCVQGHCLVIALESPLPYVLPASPEDVRYRYPTITTSFYTRPWQFGVFAPAASIGFLSRIGYFARDMGVHTGERGLDTDLGVRAALEGSFRLAGMLELTSELGMDYALDRWQLGVGDSVTHRGTRATVWAQAGLRVRPY
jgi:hypothetical protein